MSTPRPFIDAATAAQIQGLARDGFATVLQIADPKRELLIYRLDAATGKTNVVIADEFHVKATNVQAQGGGDDGSSRTLVAGTIRRFIPKQPGASRLKPGDRFALPESGPCIIQSLRPDKFGIETGEYILEQGGA